jgi:hypothetical protein
MSVASDDLKVLKKDLSDQLKGSLVWFALGMIVLGFSVAIAMQQWLKGFVDERVREAHLTPLIADQIKALDIKGLVENAGKSGVSLIAAGTVDKDCKDVKLVKIVARYAFLPPEKDGAGSCKLKFAGARPVNPFYLAGLTDDKTRLPGLILTKRDQEGFAIYSTQMDGSPNRGGPFDIGFWFLAIELSS